MDTTYGTGKLDNTGYHGSLTMVGDDSHHYFYVCAADMALSIAEAETFTNLQPIVTDANAFCYNNAFVRTLERTTDAGSTSVTTVYADGWKLKEQVQKTIHKTGRLRNHFSRWALKFTIRKMRHGNASWRWPPSSSSSGIDQSVTAKPTSLWRKLNKFSRSSVNTLILFWIFSGGSSDLLGRYLVAGSMLSLS
eukprot:gene18430-5913_t